MIDILATFIFFFAVIDPIGTVPVYIAVTNDADAQARRRIAYISAIAAAAVLLFFVIAGELILTAMKIPLEAFQIAGGIVLFLFALTMIFGESKPEQESRFLEDHDQTAIFPLAMPSIASPGAMLGAVLLTENSRFNLFEQFLTVLVMFSVIVVALLLMLLATHIHRFIGNAGASVISRVMGFILTAVATTQALAGIEGYFNL
ncbi:MAG: MarC family protein [Pseudomonadales bacterium]|nr:MarC family protein [Pseudomonadales bacterium]